MGLFEQMTPNEARLTVLAVGAVLIVRQDALVGLQDGGEIIGIGEARELVALGVLRKAGQGIGAAGFDGENRGAGLF